MPDSNAPEIKSQWSALQMLPNQPKVDLTQDDAGGPMTGRDQTPDQIIAAELDRYVENKLFREITTLEESLRMIVQKSNNPDVDKRGLLLELRNLAKQCREIPKYIEEQRAIHRDKEFWRSMNTVAFAVILSALYSSIAVIDLFSSVDLLIADSVSRDKIFIPTYSLIVTGIAKGLASFLYFLFERDKVKYGAQLQKAERLITYFNFEQERIDYLSKSS